MAQERIESIAVIPTGTGEDEVWFGAHRRINSVNQRYLEQMQTRVYGDLEDAFFVDSAVEYDSDATTTITGLDHLEGEAVIGVADGLEISGTVSSGSITLATAASHVIVGLANTYKLKPMRLDVTTKAGTTKGSIKKFAEMAVSFLKSLDVEYGIDTSNLYDVEFSSPLAENTGDVVLNIDGGFSTQDPILITGSGPFPCVVRAIIPRVDLYGR